MAYSGRTATTASTEMARALGISISATSIDQDSRKAAPDYGEAIKEGSGHGGRMGPGAPEGKARDSSRNGNRDPEPLVHGLAGVGGH